MDNKRGLSDVVTAILFILLALSAVVIIWAFISSFFGGIDLDTTSITDRFSIVSDSVLDNTEENYIELFIERDSGKTELSGIIAVLENPDGVVISEEFEGSFDRYSAKKITYYYNDSFGLVKFVAIVPVYLIDGEKKAGIEADRYELKDSDRVVWVNYDTGWKFPGSVESVDNGVGSDTWINLDNVKADDEVPSSVNLNSGKSSDYLQASNFGFDIPDGARVEGVEVKVNRWAISQPNKDSKVNLIVGGVIEGNNKNMDEVWLLNTDTIVSYGGEGDLWGIDLNVNDVKKDDFGVSLSILVPGYLSPRAGAVDYIKMKIHYKVLE